MKRQLLLTLILTMLVLLLGFFCEYGSHRFATQFQGKMLQVGLALSEENWDKALMHTTNIHAAWQKTSRVVQLWINHADIDDVTEGLLALRSAIIARDFSAALAAYNQCVENFGHLHHRDAFTLRNIL